MGTQPLAVIGRITEVEPIDGADLIQRATVVCGSAGKWSGVVGKDIAPEQLVTVFLQDAVLPPNPRWAFMERHKWRVRMARFKGVPSECVIVPGAPEMSPGTDMAEALGVTKFEKPVPVAMAGEMAGAFPSFIPKTDEPNFQVVEDWQEKLAAGDWHATEKADGTSCTIWNDEDGGMHVCSRNWELREFTASGASNVYWRAARKYNLGNLASELALQFEVVGPGIQGNPMGLADLEVRAFSLYGIRDRRYRPGRDLRLMCALLGIPTAPLLDIEPRAYTADELRALAEVRYPNGKPGEGIVIRANDSSWSMKCINLLYKG